MRLRTIFHDKATALAYVVMVLVWFSSSSGFASQAEPASGPPTISGKVVQTMNASGYTYLEVASDPAVSTWVAIPETEVTEGQEITLLPGMEMRDFHSNSFDRTFTRIIFSPGIAGGQTAQPSQTTEPSQTIPAPDSFAAAVAAEQEGGQSGSVTPESGSGGSQGAIAPFIEASVEKADGANAYTVAELFTQAQELNGQKVRVRGQVVKYNPSIMGRNWLHLQDGTGDPMHNTHDLVVTSTQDLATPRVITIEGTVAAQKDFGAGYRYDVIVEEAVIIE